MDVLVHLVRGCGCEGGVLVTEVFPAVVQRLLNCDDSAILQVSCDAKLHDPCSTPEWRRVCQSICLFLYGAASIMVSLTPTHPHTSHLHTHTLSQQA